MRVPLTFSLILSLAAIAPRAALADDLDSFAKAIDDHPNDAKAYEAYAAAALAKKRYDDAIGKLKIGVARVSEFPRGYYLLAIAYRGKQDWADAAAFYRCNLVLRPNDNNSYFGLAKSLEGLGDKEGAIANFKKYVEKEKRPEMAKFIDEAKADIAKLEPAAGTPATPGASPAATARAEAERLVAEKKLDEAAVAYKKAIELDPGNIDLYNQLGNLYFGLKRYGDAAQVFKDAVGKDPNFAIGWFNLAHAYRRADKKTEAVDAYKKYMKLKPEDADPYYGLGQTLKDLGDLPGSLAAYKKYVEMEKRPSEQKWVEKAKQQITAIEATLAPPASNNGTNQPTPGKVSDEK